MRDPRYDILFEPVRIGPVTARNRFYQVPHCNGMGYRMPRALAAMRAVKAEGGWGVVCTEEVEIHHSSDLAPNIEGRLWDDGDIPALAAMAEAVHRNGALAGIELAYHGHHASGLYSRAPGLGVRSIGVSGYHPDRAAKAGGMPRTTIGGDDPFHRRDRDEKRTLERQVREDARRLIQESAKRFLGEQPFRELTVETLMANTELSRPAFYQYFTDVHDLILSLLTEIEAEMHRLDPQAYS